ncbi:S8 family serine peptidase [Nocardiopsis sp. NPDC049922]|uniref:S8 family serine peptidase n=1 Tax=Nocardiopsis sp. NPDC049922 TaxID=3155157 RepID=UPI0033F0501F
MDQQRRAPGRATRTHRTARAAAAALLAFGLAPSPALASSDEPTALPQVTQVKGADEACAPPGTDVIARAPWTSHSLGLTLAHEMSRGRGTSVAVLATGVDPAVPALAGAVEGAASEDCLGYGTFLAGVVAARPLPDSGFVGVAPESTVVPVPTGDADTGLASPADIAAGITGAVGAGARVILVGTATYQASEALDTAVATAEAAGAVVVAPATVPTPDGPFPGFPAQDRTVLSAAAHDAAGDAVLGAPLVRPTGELARVDLTAPGAQVMSVGPGGAGHVTAAGDGVAAAFVAGAAALLVAREPDLSPAQVRERLMTTAYGSPLGTVDPIVGSGRVDPLGALAADPAAAMEAGQARVSGEAFVPEPSGLGSVEAPVTAVVVGVCALVVVLCGVGGAVLRLGRERGWRPAAPSERVTPEEDPRPMVLPLD